MVKSNKQKHSRNINISLGGVSHEEILFFTKHLSITIKSGLTLFEGIDMLYDQATGKMQKILEGIRKQLQAGMPFYEILQEYPKYFSQLYINLVRIGEVSGTLEENLSRLVEELKKSYELRQKIKSAMMYPILIFIAVVGLAFSVSIFVLPKIVPLFKTLNVELPITTRGLIYIAELFSSHGVLVTALTAGFIFFVTWLVRRDFMKPILHALFLKIPVLKKIVVHVNLERFTRTLGTLLASNITIDKGLQITAAATENRVYKKAILSLIPNIEKGNSLADALELYPKLFPKMTSRMIGMGEQTGNLDSTLSYLSDFYEGEIDSTVKNLATIIEPVMLIFIGVVVGVVAISILGPIYKITGNLRQ